MAELGSRCIIERVHIGNSPPKAARACALLGAAKGTLPQAGDHGLKPLSKGNAG